jgi:hypothetical protein
MVIAIVLLGVVLFVVSVRRLHRRTTRRSWPFVTSAVLTGLLVVLSGGGALAALTVGRATWHTWTAGTPEKESVTLGLVMLGFPLLLVLAVAFLVVGSLGDGRVRRQRTSRAQPSA